MPLYSPAAQQIRAQATQSTSPVKRELLQRSILAVNPGSNADAAAEEATHDGDYGAADYPFQGSEGDRPFVDEMQARLGGGVLWYALGGLVGGIAIMALVRR